MTSVRLALALAVAGCLADTAGAQPPAQARASIATKGDIWVGQRVTLVVELLTPGLFSSAPAFDLPQVPGVILLPPEGRPVLGSETIDGVTYTTQRHELAAYAQRPGRVTVPGFVVRFASSPNFVKPPVDRRVTTPAVTFTAKVPPGAEGLATVVTTRDLTVKETWEPQPGRGPAKPGDAFTRTIAVEARDVPGMVLPAFRFDRQDGLGVYPKSPAVEDRSERGDLTGRRVETVTYVCERPGSFALPALALAWWDPAAQKLNRVTLPAQTIEVAASPAAAAPIAEPRRRWPWAVAALAAALAIGLVAWRL